MPQHPNDLHSSHQIVGFFSRHTRRMYPLEFQQGEESIDVPGNYRLATNDSNAYTAAVLSGFGIAQLVTVIAQPLLDSGALVEILPDWKQPPLPVQCQGAGVCGLGRRLVCQTPSAAPRVNLGRPTLKRP